VHDVAKPMNLHKFGYFNRTWLANFQQIISRQINEHQVLGLLFAIGQEVGFKGVIRVPIPAPRA
jgi:hypothetical protein